MVCPDSWSQFEGHCYFLVTDKYDLSTCRAVCQAYGEGADLASIHSPGENQFLADMIQHRPVRNGEKVGLGGLTMGPSREILAISRIPGLRGR